MKTGIRILDFDSPEQRASVQLRERILRIPLGLRYSKEELQNEFDQIHIGAFLDNVIVGILLLKAVDDQLIKMRQVAVDTTLQGKGVGRNLVVFAEGWARENAYKKIELHARQEAVQFYLNLGYEIVDDPFYEVGILHRKMIKNI